MPNNDDDIDIHDFSETPKDETKSKGKKKPKEETKPEPKPIPPPPEPEEPEPIGPRIVQRYPHDLNWLTDYTYYNSNNEAPKRFHVFSGLACLASAISRKVWIEQGYFTHYPNLYVVMVGPPGDGKSTALDVAKEFIRKMGTVPLAADSMTTQSLMRRMSEEGSPCHKSVKLPGQGIVEYSPITIFAGELISFISMDPYGWITFLTTVYHEKVHEVGTKNKGDDLIKGPYLTLLGCLTPETSANLLQQKIVSSGMARRTIWVWSSGRTEPQPFPVITDSQTEALRRCYAWAMHLAKNVKGAFTWTQETIDFYGPWYIHLQKNLHKFATPSTTGYFKSKHVQLLKLTMLLSLSESDALVLELRHMRLALSILEEVEPDMEKVFSGQGRNQEAAVAAKLMQLVEDSDSPPLKKALYGLMYHEAARDEIDRIVKHLILQEKLVEDSFRDEKTGRVYGPYLFTPSQKKRLIEKLEASMSPETPPVSEPVIELDLDAPPSTDQP